MICSIGQINFIATGQKGRFRLCEYHDVIILIMWQYKHNYVPFKQDEIYADRGIKKFEYCKDCYNWFHDFRSWGVFDTSYSERVSQFVKNSSNENCYIAMQQFLINAADLNVFFLAVQLRNISLRLSLQAKNVELVMPENFYKKTWFSKSYTHKLRNIFYQCMDTRKFIKLTLTLTLHSQIGTLRFPMSPGLKEKYSLFSFSFHRYNNNNEP